MKFDVKSFPELSGTISLLSSTDYNSLDYKSRQHIINECNRRRQILVKSYKHIEKDTILNGRFCKGDMPWEITTNEIIRVMEDCGITEDDIKDSDEDIIKKKINRYNNLVELIREN